MRILFILLLILLSHRSISQQSATLKDTVDKALVSSERLGSYFSLDKSKVSKLYNIDKKLEPELAKVPLQFKDSIGRRLAYGRLERVRDQQYQGVLSKEQYKEYRLKKNQLLR